MRRGRRRAPCGPGSAPDNGGCRGRSDVALVAWSRSSRRGRELGGIPVGGDGRRQNPFARRDHHAADGYVLGGESIVRVVHRVGEPEQLVDWHRDQRRVLAQPRLLLRVPQQRHGAGGDQVHGGVEARHDRQVDRGKELVAGSPSASPTAPTLSLAATSARRRYCRSTGQIALAPVPRSPHRSARRMSAVMVGQRSGGERAEEPGGDGGDGSCDLWAVSVLRQPLVLRGQSQEPVPVS